MPGADEIRQRLPSGYIYLQTAYSWLLTQGDDATGPN